MGFLNGRVANAGFKGELEVLTPSFLKCVADGGWGGGLLSGVGGAGSELSALRQSNAELKVRPPLSLRNAHPHTCRGDTVGRPVV